MANENRESSRIAIAADHNGVDLKAFLFDRLAKRGISVLDLGTNDTQVVDYPYLCARIGKELNLKRVDRAIMIGGSGQGEAIALNKIHGIRAGLCNSLFDAEISSGHNNSNVLVLAGKVLTSDFAMQIVDVWLDTPFKGGIHQVRLDLISKIEEGEDIG